MFTKVLTAGFLLAIAAGTANASCSTMQSIANDSARAAASRDDQGHHEWFYAKRDAAMRTGKPFALAENLAPTGNKGRAMAMWRASPGHASNLALSGPRFACKAIGTACNKRHCYAAMEIGPTDQALAGNKPEHRRVKHSEREIVLASTYNDGTVDANGMTVAHPTLEHGTRLTVSHGHRKVMVTVNDTGPAPWTKRKLDLTPAVNRYLQCGGLCRVVIEHWPPLPPPRPDIPESKIVFGEE